MYDYIVIHACLLKKKKKHAKSLWFENFLTTQAGIKTAQIKQGVCFRSFFNFFTQTSLATIKLLSIGTVRCVQIV